MVKKKQEEILKEVLVAERNKLKGDFKKYLKFTALCGVVWFLDLFLFFKLFSSFQFFITFKWFSVWGVLLINAFVVGGVFFILINNFFAKRFKRILKELQPEKEIKGEAEEGLKRVGFIKRLRFKWICWIAEGKLKEYKERQEKLQEKVGKIRGHETKVLERIKEEAIEIIINWTEDFKITMPKSNVLVTEELLNELTLDELYDEYLYKGVLTLENFVNGKITNEKEINI